MDTIARKEINDEHNGVEIYFTTFPIKATRENLKANGFKWNHKKCCWFAKRTKEIEALADIYAGTSVDEYKEFAVSNNETTSTVIPKKPKEKTNKFGVKVGDYFYTSWGYEQTNINFFQVIKLVGELSVRVREVYPAMIEETGVSGMSADRTYDLSNKELRPPAIHSVFINDQENGDLKRLKSYSKDGKHPQFFLSSFADAYFCENDKETLYESWYY